MFIVPPSGGSLEIGNKRRFIRDCSLKYVPPSGGSLEIGNITRQICSIGSGKEVPPSGGSLEIGNSAMPRGW